MSHQNSPSFKGGLNVAIKSPHHTYEQTIEFYQYVLGLPLLEKHEDSCVFQFGPVRLWLDRVANLSHLDIWLEVETSDVAAASSYLQDQGVARRDEVEALPDQFDGFWISSPSGVIHLVSGKD